YATQPVSDELKPVADMLAGLAAKYNEAVEKVNAMGDTTYTDFMARRLVEMAGNLVMSWLLVTDATRYASESMTKSAKIYSKIAQAEVEKHAEFIANFTPDQIDLYKQA
ncbi:MAG: acyl-CoA dehydrogenase, partial [Muribaculaceae bacterium]|nr:acyl-CoA dehydrogenase [Muribaculaceae bacterium]